MKDIKPESLRKLRGWDKLTEEEFNEKYEMLIYGGTKDAVVDEKLKRIKKQFEDEYDLSELLPNDRMVLDTLIQSMVLLEMYQAQQFEIMKDPKKVAISTQQLKDLGTICKDLAKSISDMQNDLKITRRSRKSDKEQSTITFLEDLKAKAKKFYEQKMHYVICPNCNTVLATVWWLYPRNKNYIEVTCHRELEDGKICGTKVRVGSHELVETGSNIPEVLPEALR